MSENRAAGWPGMPRGLALLSIVAVLTATSYRVTSAWLGSSAGGRRSAPNAHVSASTSHRGLDVPSGRYLIAFVLLSSECGFCTEKSTKKAVGDLRASLHASQGKAFAKVSVVGVAIDPDLRAGVRYLENLERSGGAAFDELSVGGSWLNQVLTALVWRDDMVKPQVPQVVLIERRVDAGGYPRYLDMQPDSMLLNVTGRDSLIAWVNRGTPLDLRRSARVARSGATQ